MVSSQTIRVDGMGDTNFGVELCSLTGCMEYEYNQTMQYNTTEDYILKITPVNVDSADKLTGYIIGDNFYRNIILFMLFLAVIVMFMMVLGNAY